MYVLGDFWQMVSIASCVIANLSCTLFRQSSFFPLFLSLVPHTCPLGFVQSLYSPFFAVRTYASSVHHGYDLLYLPLTLRVHVHVYMYPHILDSDKALFMEVTEKQRQLAQQARAYGEQMQALTDTEGGKKKVVVLVCVPFSILVVYTYNM